MSATEALPSPGMRGAELAIVAASAVLASFAAAGPHLFDAGEIVAAAARLGGSHPPGQPLHALIAYAATLFPLGPLAWRVALVSVLFGALAARSAAGIVSDAMARAGVVRGSLTLIPALTALAVLSAPAIAPQLGRPEVYTLALFLAVAGARRLIAWAARDPGIAERSLRVAALSAGLAVAVHPPHALALLAIGLTLTVGLRRDLLKRPSAIALAALACFVGMLAIAYLPLRAWAGAPMWGEPTSPSGLYAYVSGSAYRANLGAREGSWLGNALAVAAFVLVPTGVGVVIAIGASLTKHVAALERRRLLAIAAAASAAIVAACLQPLERANPDNVAYAGTAIALFVVLGLTAIVALRGVLGGALPMLAAGALAISSAAASGDPREWLDADLPQLESLAFAALDGPPPRALVIARTDFVASTWMQGRDVDGARPDVALLIEGLSTSSWHWRTLAGHPLFDGSPMRSGSGPGYAPWIRGAVVRALGRVPVLAEGDAPLEGRGLVLGPYLVMPDAPTSATVRVHRAFAERTAGAPARMIAYTPAGFGGAGHGVVREAEMVRAKRLFARDRTALAIDGLRRATAPLPEGATAAAGELTGSPRRPMPTAVRDRTSIYATAEDAVRELAVLVVALGAPERALELLAAQAERGDDRALLQLAWVHASSGLREPALGALERYGQLHPEREDELRALTEQLR